MNESCWPQMVCVDCIFLFFPTRRLAPWADAGLPLHYKIEQARSWKEGIFVASASTWVNSEAGDDGKLSIRLWRNMPGWVKLHRFTANVTALEANTWNCNGHLTSCLSNAPSFFLVARCVRNLHGNNPSFLSTCSIYSKRISFISCSGKNEEEKNKSTSATIIGG